MKKDSLLPEAILGICVILALIALVIFVPTQDYASQRIYIDTNAKPKNAFWDRWCATRSESYRSQSAYCKNR